MRALRLVLARYIRLWLRNMPTKHSKWLASSKKSEKSVKGGLRNGKRESRGRRNGVTKGAQSVSQEDVAVERTTMLLERQAELDQIMDKHDTMVSFSVNRGVHCFIFGLGTGGFSLGEVRDSH